MLRFIGRAIHSLVNPRLKERLPGVSTINHEEVADAITAAGRWSRDNEWRISTVTSTEISRTDDAIRHRKYKVRVECDFILEAYCPTITRAIEIATAYELLIQRLWHELGWPSWASKRELDPGPDSV